MRRVAVICLAIALAVLSSAAAEIALEKAARIDVNPTRAIASDGQIVYAGVGGALNIYNIYQRDFPQLVGTVEGHHSNIQKIIVEGNRLYVLWEKEGLEIFDISDYYTPRLLGEFPIFESPDYKAFMDMDLDGDVLYVGGADFIASVDVSEPFNPVQVNYASMNGSAIKIDYHNNSLYIAAGHLGLGRMFVPNPEQFFFQGAQNGVYTTIKAYEDIILYGRLDPRDPNEQTMFGQHLFSFPFPSPTVVDVHDGVIFAGGLEHFAVYRLHDGSHNPDLIWRLGGMPTLDCVLRDDVLYLANSHRGLSAYSVVDVANPVEIGRLETFDMPRRAALEDGHLYLAAGTSGVLHYDISVPEYPIYLKNFGAERLINIWDVAIWQDEVFVLGARESNTENIFVLRYRANGDWIAEYPITRVSNLDPIGEMVFGDDVVAISLGSEGIAIRAFEKGAIRSGGYDINRAELQFCDLVIEGKTLFASDYWGGYHAFDLSGVPRKISHIKTSTQGGNGLAFVDGYLLAADGPEGLAVIEWSIPEAPRHIASFGSTWGTDIAVDGDFAFMSDGQGALKVYDISALPKIELAAELPDNGYWTHVYVDNGLLVGLDQFHGVHVYRVRTEEFALAKDAKSEMPREADISGSFPNPFNAEVTVSFHLPEQTHADLSIYDITGRRQITLISDRLPKGDYNLRWKPSEAPSGTYFAVLTTPDKQVSKKLLLVK